jgi:hypothetical protein
MERKSRSSSARFWQRTFTERSRSERRQTTRQKFRAASSHWEEAMDRTNPFHQGELEAQRLAGEAEQSESNGAMVSDKLR